MMSLQFVLRRVTSAGGMSHRRWLKHHAATCTRGVASLGYEPNSSHMPKFKPQDNSTGFYDKSTHMEQSWSSQ